MQNLNKTQSREYKRAKKSKGFLEENEAVYSTNLPFTTEVNLFYNNCDELELLVPQKHISGGDVTADKNALKIAVANEAIVICSRTKAYAQIAGNTDLLSIVSHSHSYFIKLKEADVLGNIKVIADAIDPLLKDAEFEAYNVTTDMVKSLLGKATAFDNVIGKATLITGNGRYAAKAIDAVLKKIGGNIDRLSLMVNNFSDNAQFMANFKVAIKVDKTDIHHNGVEGTITDKAGQPVRNARISVPGKEKDKSTSTDYLGFYKLGIIEPKFMEVTIEAPGFETKVIAVKIQQGRFIKLDITLNTVAVSLLATA